LDRLAKTVAHLERRAACLETQAKLAQAKTDDFQAFVVDAMRKLLPPSPPPPTFCESCFFFTTDSAGNGWCTSCRVSINATDRGCKNYLLNEDCA